MVGMLKTAKVKEYIQTLSENDCEVNLNLDTGTATAYDSGNKVFAAIQKGRGQPWIVRYINSHRIKWG